MLSVPFTVLSRAVALLALIAGLGGPAWPSPANTTFRTGSPPSTPATKVPHRAEITLAVVIWAIISVADLRGAIGFSSFGVLIYYLVANIAAFTQPDTDPKALQVLGAAACVALVATLPPLSVVLGILMFTAGIILRLVRLRRKS